MTWQVQDFRVPTHGCGVNSKGFQLPEKQRGNNKILDTSGRWFQEMHPFGLLVLYPGQPEIQKNLSIPMRQQWNL